MEDIFKTTKLGERFDKEGSKSRKTLERIILGAVEAYALYGLEGTNRARIAATSGVSRTLTIHYFPQLDEIFFYCIRYIRFNMQKLAIERIQQARSSREVLRNYVLSTFEWTETYPNHAKVWLLFFFHCSTNKESNELNTESTRIGHQRIAALIESFNEVKNELDASRASKQIQTIITGALVTYITEELDSKEEFKESITDLCSSLVFKN